MTTKQKLSSIWLMCSSTFLKCLLNVLIHKCYVYYYFLKFVTFSIKVIHTLKLHAWPQNQNSLAVCFWDLPFSLYFYSYLFASLFSFSFFFNKILYAACILTCNLHSSYIDFCVIEHIIDEEAAGGIYSLEIIHSLILLLSTKPIHR